MNSYMVVATFKDGVTPEDIRALIPAEQAQAKLLVDQGLLGFIKVAMPRRTVFLEAFGENDDKVLENIKSLPFFEIWNIDVFQTTPPAGASF